MTHSPTTAAVMREAAGAFLSALTQDQRARATAAFDTPDHREWTYLPGSRPGLSLREMDEGQHRLAIALMGTGLGAAGLATAADIMALEAVLADLERSAGRRAGSVAIPGTSGCASSATPDHRGPWAWRVNGHHLAVHLTVVGDGLAGTPQFFGANPAVVPRGPQQGRRTLPLEEDLARDLLGLLDADQLAVAVTDPVAPGDIATRRDPVADPAVRSAGPGARGDAPGPATGVRAPAPALRRPAHARSRRRGVAAR